MSRRDFDWNEVVRGGRKRRPPASRSTPRHPLTSSTPRGPRQTQRSQGDHGGHAVALLLVDEGSLRRRPWRRLLGRLGHGLGGRPLLYRLWAAAGRGATTVVYEGKPVGTPDAGAFWRVVEGASCQGAVHGPDGDPCHPDARTPAVTSSSSTT